MKTRNFFCGVALFALSLCGPAHAADNLLITEVMADNNGALRDEDSDASDWIELHNAGTITANLDGWFLTDNAGQLSQWRFPATNLPPKAYLIVFASGKNRHVPGAPLHTNFKLSNNGEYLALVAPDGTNVVSAYAPLFPAQVSGVSYGVPVTQSNTTLIAVGAMARVLVPPDNALLAAWTLPEFDDAGWLSAPTGVGFDTDAQVPFVPMTLANSRAEFSGAQGQDNWFYGYWDRKADADGIYSDADFTPFPNDGGAFGPDNFFNAASGIWDWFQGDPPQTELASDGGRPADSTGNPALPDHWAVRRYVNENAGPIAITGSITHTSDWVYVTQSGVAGTGLLYIYLQGAGESYIDDMKLVSGLVPELGANLLSNGDFEAATLSPWTVSANLANSVQSTAIKHGGSKSLRIISTATGSSQGTSIWQAPTVTAGTIYTLSYWYLPITNSPPAVVRTSGSWLNTTPVSCGDRTIARIFVDGVQVFQRQATVSGVNYSLTAQAHLGSKIDFALDPGSSGLVPCVNTIFTATIANTDPATTVVADSAADWSVTGTQGEKNWFYGYYNRSADPDRIYQPANFTAFPHDGGPPGANNFWDEQEWDWPSGDPPFDKLGQYWMTPNGTNSTGGEHWVIRRWVSEVGGTLTMEWSALKEFPDQNNSGGGGVTVRVFHKDVQRDVFAVLGGDTVGVRRTVTITNVQVGDPIDIAVDPTNVGNVNPNVVPPSGPHDDTDKTFVTAVIRGTPSLNHLVGADLAASMRDVNATAYVRLPFTVADPSAFNALTLRMKFDDGFIAYLNGVEVARDNAPLEAAWNSGATAPRSDAENNQWQECNLTSSLGLLRAGANVLAIHGLNVSAGDRDFLVLPELEAASVANDLAAQRYFMLPTPGTANGYGNTNLGPLVFGASHLPNVPKDNQDLLVTAQVSPTFHPVSTVRLFYRVMFSNEVSAPMFDDGQHGDGATGDGIWGATIPASASNPGQMVRYYVYATDTQTNNTRFPAFLEPKNSPQYQGTVVPDPSLTNGLPVLHFFVQNVPAATNFAGTRASIFWDDEFFDNIGVNAHGQTTWYQFPKRSMNFNLNTGHKLQWKRGENRVKAFDLLTTSPDKAHMRLVMGFEAFRDVGVPTHYAFPVRLQENGAFNAIYSFVEQANDDFLERNRLNPDGALYKIYLGLTDAYTGAKKVTRKNEPNDDLQAMLNGLNQSGGALRQYLFDNVNIPEVVNFLAAIQVVQNEDCCGKNYFLYRDTEGTGEWQMLPWDLDLTFGRVFTQWIVQGTNIYGGYYNTNIYATNLYYTQARSSFDFIGVGTDLVNAIFSFPDTQEMFYRRWSSVQEELLQRADTHPLLFKFERRADELAAQIAADAVLDFNKWTPMNPPTFLLSQTMPQAVSLLKTGYFAPRRPWAFNYLAYNNGGPYVGTQPANAAINFGAVEYNPSSANQDQEYVQLLNTNRYAVDISGWRLTGGIDYTFQPGVVLPASNGVLYVSPNVNAFRARTSGPRGGQGLFVQGNYRGQLSARGEPLQLVDRAGRSVAATNYPGTSSLAQQYLRVTEIMYHPEPAVINLITNAEEFEFIELKNIGPVAISLLGVRFVNGIEFDFTGGAITSLEPGERVVLIRNLAAFASRYGGTWRVAGQYAGLLDNSGENLRLVDASGEEILDFSFDNDWYPVTDGNGRSLVIADETAIPESWGLKTSWLPGDRSTGSPGWSLPPGDPIPPIVINEALTHTDPPAVDAVELFNPTGEEADLGGWYLTDDLRNPRKYQIEDMTFIPPGGYLVLTENNFRPTNPPSPAGFALSSSGDEIYLFSANLAGELTGYYHGFVFAAAENGVSFGRHTNSVGAEHFVAQTTTSFGSANAGPKVGPVVISEIHYHPPDFADGGDNSDDEFIELQNMGLNPGGVFPGTPPPTNGWRMHGGVDFDLPPTAVVLPGSFLLLVNFNPADTARLAAFRGKFSVPDGVPILGPYRGQLDNSSGTVKLSRPDAPDAGEVPYILVDQVDYADSAPWPGAADGHGVSLQRRDAAQYGNDPVNWTAAVPSAGRAAAAGLPPAITVQPVGGDAVASLTAMLTVGASGAPTLNYQWRFNGANLPGATSSSLVLSNVQPGQAGVYSVTVFNSAGSVESSNVTLNVLLGPYFTQQPASATARVGNTVTFTAAAIGSSPVAYQWRLNGANAPGTVSSTPSNSTLTLANVQFSHAGEYTVIATDNVASFPSAPATLTLLVDPLITQQPLSQSVVPGANVTLSVTVTNTATLPLGFRWRRNGTSIPGGFFVQNQYTAYYTVTNVQAPLTNYTVFVTNVARPVPGIGSTSAFLFLVADTDGDRLPDDWETNHFGSTDAAPDGDADLDGMTNEQEYIAGTNPADDQSYLKVDTLTVANSATLTFNAVSNRTYTVQYADTLGAANQVPSASWTKLADVVARATNRTEVVVDSHFTTNRYYRLAVPRQP